MYQYDSLTNSVLRRILLSERYILVEQQGLTYEDIIKKLEEKGCKVITDPSVLHSPEVNQRLKQLHNIDPANPVTSQEVAWNKIKDAIILIDRTFSLLSSFIRDLNPVCNHPDINTMAVDRSWNLYYNTDFVAWCSVRELMFVLVHEVSHLGFSDLHRSNNYNVKIWNIASDLVNNWYIYNEIEGRNEMKTSNPNAKDVNINMDIPPGGLQPDNDGVVRKFSLPLTGNMADLDVPRIMVELPKDKWIDLNGKPTEVVYECIKDLGDDLIDFLDQSRFDAHIHQTSLKGIKINIKKVKGEKPERRNPQPKSPKLIQKKDITKILIKDKTNGKYYVAVSYDEKEDTVQLVPLTDDEAEALKNQQRQQDAAASGIM